MDWIYLRQKKRNYINVYQQWTCYLTEHSFHKDAARSYRKINFLTQSMT